MLLRSKFYIKTQYLSLKKWLENKTHAMNYLNFVTPSKKKKIKLCFAPFFHCVPAEGGWFSVVPLLITVHTVHIIKLKHCKSMIQAYEVCANMISIILLYNNVHTHCTHWLNYAYYIKCKRQIEIVKTRK